MHHAQVRLALRDLPLAEDRVAQGHVLVRLDPTGAPAATGASEDDLAVAALEHLEAHGANPFGHEAADAEFARAAAQSAEERAHEAEEKEQVRATACLARLSFLARFLFAGTDRCAFLSFDGLGRLLPSPFSNSFWIFFCNPELFRPPPFFALFFFCDQAARDAADQAADANADQAAKADQAEADEQQLHAAPHQPPPGHEDASPLELKWPLADVFVADALRNYVELLEVCAWGGGLGGRAKSKIKASVAWERIVCY